MYLYTLNIENLNKFIIQGFPFVADLFYKQVVSACLRLLSFASHCFKIAEEERLGAEATKTEKCIECNRSCSESEEDLLNRKLQCYSFSVKMALPTAKVESNRWIFSQEQVKNTPSRQHGMSAIAETHQRQQAANLVQEIGQKLQVYPYQT